MNPMNRTWSIIIAAALVVMAIVFVWTGWESEIDSPDTAPQSYGTEPTPPAPPAEQQTPAAPPEQQTPATPPGQPAP